MSGSISAPACTSRCAIRRWSVPPPATGPGEWNEPWAVHASGVAPLSASPRRVRAAGEQRRDDVAVAPPRARGAAACRPSRPGRPIGTPSSSRISTAARRPSAAAWCSASANSVRTRSARVGVLAPPAAAPRRGRRRSEADQLVDRADLAPRAELGQQLAEVRPAHPPREPVRRALVLLVPRVHVGAGLDQHPQHLRRAPAVDRPQQRRLDLVAGLVVEQQPQHRGLLGVEAVRERVGALDARARREQQPQAGVVAGLGRVVDGLVVVRVRARLQQERGHARLVRDAGGAVERAQRAELGVLPARVRVGAGLEQRPRALDQPVRALAAEERGVAGVEQRQPVARAAGSRGEAGVARRAPRAPARPRRARARRRAPRAPRSGSSASSASAWSRRPFVASSTSCRARSSRATASASTRRTSRGQLASPSSRATASWASESLPPDSFTRRFASRRARSRSIRRSIADHLTCRPRSACRAEVDRNTTFRSLVEVGLRPCPRTRVRPRAHRKTYPRRRLTSQAINAVHRSGGYSPQCAASPSCSSPRSPPPRPRAPAPSSRRRARSTPASAAACRPSRTAARSARTSR